MQGTFTGSIPYSDYTTQLWGGLETLNDKGSKKPVIISYTISNPISNGRKHPQQLQTIWSQTKALYWTYKIDSRVTKMQKMYHTFPRGVPSMKGSQRNIISIEIWMRRWQQMRIVDNDSKKTIK